MSPFLTLLALRMMKVVVTTGAIRRAKLQSNLHHQHTSIQTLLQAGCPSCHPTNSVRAHQTTTDLDQSYSYVFIPLHNMTRKTLECFIYPTATCYLLLQSFMFNRPVFPTIVATGAHLPNDSVQNEKSAHRDANTAHCL